MASKHSKFFEIFHEKYKSERDETKLKQLFIDERKHFGKKVLISHHDENFPSTDEKIHGFTADIEIWAEYKKWLGSINR